MQAWRAISRIQPALRRAGRFAFPGPGAARPEPAAGHRGCRHCCRSLAPAPSTERAQALSRRATVAHSKCSWEYPCQATALRRQVSDNSLQTTAFRQHPWASLSPTVTGRGRRLYESNPSIPRHQGYSRLTVNRKLRENDQFSGNCSSSVNRNASGYWSVPREIVIDASVLVRLQFISRRR
jgi:hypothetical protein